MWKINEIRQRTGYAEQKKTEKDALRDYLLGRKDDFNYAVTLTFNGHVKVANEKGVYYKTLEVGDVARTAAHFKNRLNRLTLGSAAKNFGKSLNYMFVVEGVQSGKHLHLHLAVGGELRKIKSNEFAKTVVDAAADCELLGEQLDVQVMDSGWLQYITKEVDKHDTINVLWELA